MRVPYPTFRYIRIALALALVGGGGALRGAASSAGGDTDDARLRTAMAAYLVNFALHVRWPEEVSTEGTPLTIAVLGPDRLGDLLDRAVEGRTAGGRPLRVTRAARMDELEACDLIFMDGPSAAEAEEVAGTLTGRPVLLVAFTRLPGGTMAGVDLVVMRDGTLRYKLAVSRLRAAGLTPSAGLLQHAIRGEDRSRLFAPEERGR